MNDITLLVLAAGMGSRYGGLKQIDTFGQGGEALLEYAIYDAIRAGFSKVVFVIRENFYKEFIEKFKDTFQDKIKVEYVFQNIIYDLDGKEYGENREKPRGTAHAVLAAKDVINEPFAVINADDYYGVEGYQKIVKYLSTTITPKKCCIISYILEKTLSDSGYVNRGICEVSNQHQLVSVEEHLKIQKDKNGIVRDGEGNELHSHAVVSMNFRGFHQSIFSEIEKKFGIFLRENGKNPKAEYYITFFIDTLIHKKKLICDVIPSNEQRCGVTYPTDKQQVVKHLTSLTEEGVYPLQLWKN